MPEPLERHRVAVVVFIEAEGVDRLDAHINAVTAVRFALRDQAIRVPALLDLFRSWVRSKPRPCYRAEQDEQIRSAFAEHGLTVDVQRNRDGEVTDVTSADQPRPHIGARVQTPKGLGHVIEPAAPEFKNIVRVRLDPKPEDGETWEFNASFVTEVPAARPRIGDRVQTPRGRGKLVKVTDEGDKQLVVVELDRAEGSRLRVRVSFSPDEITAVAS